MNEMILRREPVEREVNLLDLVQSIVSRKRLVMKVTGGALLLSTVGSFLLPSEYSATARIIPPQKETASISSLLGQVAGLSSLAGGGGTVNTDLYVGILKSRSVSDAVIDRFALAKEWGTKTPEETRRKLDRVVRIQAGKDGIIAITAESRSPGRAAALANALVEEAGKKSVLLNLTKAGTERTFLEKRLVLAKEDLRRAEEALRSFQEANKAIKVDSQSAAAIEGVARLKAEIVAREVQLSSLRSYQTDETPQVKMLQAAVAKLRSQLREAMGRGGGEDGIPSLGTVPGIGVEYLRRMRELKTQEAVFEQLMKQYEVAKLGEAKDSSALQVLDEAVVPVKPVKPHRLLIVIGVTGAALAGALLSALFLEHLGQMGEADRRRLEQIRLMLVGRNQV